MFSKNDLDLSLDEGGMYLVALHKKFTETVNSSQVHEKRTIQRQTSIINKMTENWDKKQSEIWNRFLPSKPMIFLSIAVMKNSFAQIFIIFLISHLASTLNFSLLNLD